MALPRTNLFHLRKRSLLRGVLLSLCSFAVSLRVAGFPRVNELHGSPWQMLVALLAACAMVDTARCLRNKWSLYHAGVLILLYSELMILAMVVFLSIYQ